jgi:hypothetical protein
MKLRFFVLAVALIFLMNYVSAEIVILQSPSGLYNLGDIVSVPIKITSLAATGEVFSINLICNGAEIELHREYVLIQAGEEIEKNPPLPLIKGFIGNSKGACGLKYVFGNEAKLTNEFTISDLVMINISTSGNEFAPEQEIIVDGQAKKENGKEANGFVDMELIQGNESKNIFASDTVKNGIFTLKFSVPEETASGQYLLKINAYEKDSKSEITNNGFANYNIFISQVPTSLEIFVESQKLAPGETARVKTVLHDQTGVPMDAASNIIVQNSRGKTIEQKEIATNEFLEVQIPSDSLPSNWTIKASSNQLASESKFEIKTVEKIKTEIIDKTLIVANIGNVLYNHTVLVKVGEQPLNIDVLLDVGESQKYTLSAPDGKYGVEVIVNGKSSISEDVLLTGKAVDIRESGISLENNTAVWIVVILILAFFGVKLFKKWHNKSFFGYVPSGNAKFRSENKKEIVQLKKSSVITRNKAELELSIKGDQQDVSVVCLKIKNIDKLKGSKTNYEGVLQEIVNVAEEQKAYIYGAQENIFFIYAPTKTKTFRNEKTAIDLAQKIEQIIGAYNKLAKEKILGGISVDYGAIVANSEGNMLKFMSLGTLMNSSKKLASLSEGEALLSEKIRDKLGSGIKTQKKEVAGTAAYTIREIRDEERSSEFIRRFLDRMEK